VDREELLHEACIHFFSALTRGTVLHARNLDAFILQRMLWARATAFVGATRERRAMSRYGAEPPPQPTDPHQRLEDSEARHAGERPLEAAAQAALALLSRLDRQIIGRRLLLSQAHSKIAEDLKISEAAVRQRYSRAVRTLRDALSHDDFAAAEPRGRS
jgi:DNA-directed RNA polymerase specialized sigma24 family protein